MIKSFKHRGLKKFWETGSKAGIPTEMAKRVRIRLSYLDVAETLNDINLPGYRLHPMAGQRKGEWSIKVTGNWRIVFRMDAPGEVTGVHLKDYH